MDINVRTGDSVRQRTKAIVVNLFEGTKKPGGAAAAVDRALGGAISQLIEEGEIKGKYGELTLLHTLGPRKGRRAGAEGAVMGLSRFLRHKKPQEDQREIGQLTLVEVDRKKTPALRQGVATGRILGEAANRARAMANEPANLLTPTVMAEQAPAIAAEAGLEG